jgi:D-alanyl-D-alanine carboxypeptidase/D-alanyl-D-alanine-endopeptidase (penicillin-binding protein 4)
MLKYFELLIFTAALILSQCSLIQINQDERAAETQLPPQAVQLNVADKFQKQIEEIINKPVLDPAFISIQIEEYPTGEVIYALNPKKLMIPASNMKLFTTISSLILLGPDFHYKTYLYYEGDGNIENGMLTGNLYLKGSGDPTLSTQIDSENYFNLFQVWADSLKSLGIRQINGTLIGDDNVFDDLGLGHDWSWDDLSYYYTAPTSALSYSDNCMNLYVVPGDSIGISAGIVTKPLENYLKIKNNICTVSNDSVTKIESYRYPGEEEVTVNGIVPLNADTIKEQIPVDDPTDFALNAFKSILERNGISVSSISDIDEIPDYCPDYDKMHLIYIHESIPLSQIIKTINKISQNFYAEQLLKTLGHELRNDGSAQGGITVEKEWFNTIGIKTEDIAIIDGSGLSHNNLVTAEQIIKLLYFIRSHQHWETFRESLSVSGQDGTLQHRLKDSNAAGHIYAKTGSMKNVKALSGFIYALNGREYLFSILVNHYSASASEIDNLLDQIATTIYNFSD